MINSKFLIDINNYERLEKIGSGSFSAVFLVKNHGTDKIYAAKMLREEIDKNSPEFYRLLSQISILFNLAHPAIIKYKGLSIYDFNHEIRPIILTEYMEKGSLQNVINKEKRAQTPEGWNATKKLINIFGIASAMKYLHSHNIAHRDLKPDNVLEDDNFYPKICDFQLSNFEANRILNSQSDTFGGTPLFMAPEIIEIYDDDGEPVSLFYADVYSFAMTVFVLMGCQIPTQKTFFQIARKVTGGERFRINESVPASYRKIIEDCWVQDPKERPTFAEIVERLKTDKGFITDEVDIEEYQTYIKRIELQPNKEEEEENNEDKKEEKIEINDDDDDEIEINDDDDEKIEINDDDDDEIEINDDDDEIEINDDDDEIEINDDDDDEIEINDDDDEKIEINDDDDEIEINDDDDEKIEENDDVEQIDNEMNLSKFKKPFLIPNIKNLNLKNFEKKEKIGVGYFGDVFKIISKSNGSIYAAKILKDEILEENKETKIAINLLREVSILSKLFHPSIMKFHGYSATDFIDIYRPVLITEYLKNGTLEDIIEIERSGLKITFWDETMKFINIYGVALAMSFLHSKDVLHRDLKPANILLNEYLFPKISDFGFSKYITDNPETELFNIHLSMSRIMGTCGFIAPEIWKDKTYTKAGDVYAFAMFVYEMLTFQLPFHGLIDFQICVLVAEKEKRPPLPNNIQPCYEKLIRDCWSQDPKKRPTFDEIINRLKTEKDFTKNIDKNLFLNYIDFIEKEHQKKASNYQFRKYELSPIYNEFKESKSMFLTEGFIKIDEFFNKSEIYRNDFSCFYDVVEKTTGQIYSAEVSNFDFLNFSKKDKENLSKEVGILSKLRHPAIQQIIGYSFFDFEHQPNPVIIKEHLKNKRLFDLLENERNGKKEMLWNDTKKLINIYGIASGMLYLHSNNIIHHELNTKNIFVDEKLNPKISEFGFFIKPSNSIRAKSQSTSINDNIPYFIAPEILQSNNNDLITKSSDVYSFAFVMFEILSNEIPFKKIKDIGQFIDEVVKKGLRPSLEKIPKNYRKLISACWSNDPNKRPNFEYIISNLRKNKKFITKEVVQKEYQSYMDFVDANNCSSYMSKMKSWLSHFF